MDDGAGQHVREEPLVVPAMVFHTPFFLAIHVRLKCERRLAQELCLLFQLVKLAFWDEPNSNKRPVDAPSFFFRPRC